jgi:hypothetical protein
MLLPPRIDAYLKKNIQTSIERAMGNNNPDGLPIPAWLGSMPNPAQTTLSFYRSLYSELIEHTLQAFEENLTLMGELLDRGINIIDFVGHDMCPTEGYASAAMQLLPTLAMGKEGIRDGLPNYQEYRVAVEQMDALYTRALTLPSSLNWTEENEALPFTTQESKLFAVLRNARDGLHYLAHSSLTARCMDKWFEDLEHIDSVYRECMWVEVSALFRYAHQFTPVPYKPLARELVLGMAKGFSEFRDGPGWHNGPGHRFWTVDLPNINHLEFSHEQSQELAVHLLKGGYFKEAGYALYPLLQAPGLFAEALRAAGISDTLAQEHFCHCLALHIYDLKIIVGPTLKSWIDECRAAFLAYGFADIKGTRALDGILIHVEAAEYFHSIGYLSQADANLGIKLLIIDNMEPTFLGDDPVERLGLRAIDIAIKTGQQETMVRLIGDFLNGSRAACRFYNLSVARYVLEREPVPASDVIKSKYDFAAAWRCGVFPRRLLLDGKFRPYAESMVAQSLAR